MDSASPIAQRTAGQTSGLTGAFTFTFAMWTTNAENVAISGKSRSGCGPSVPYRDDHRRSASGEGQPA